MTVMVAGKSDIGAGCSLRISTLNFTLPLMKRPRGKLGKRGEVGVLGPSDHCDNRGRRR
jgi:hypothetical protein